MTGKGELWYTKGEREGERERDRHSHRTGCTGPDPTNFWEAIMGPTQNCAKYVYYK